MPTWPATLPQTPTIDGYSEQFQSNTISTQMDVGPAKVRRRTTTNVKKYNVRFVMTAAQLVIFEDFYDNDIYSGALSFDFPDPRSGATGDFRIDVSQGAPQISAADPDIFEISFQMEKLP